MTGANSEFGRLLPLQIALLLGTCVVVLNPLVLAFFLHMSLARIVYLLVLDAAAIVAVVMALRCFRRPGRRAWLALAVALLSLPILAVATELGIDRVRDIDPALLPAKQGDTITVHMPDRELGWVPVPATRARHIEQGNFDVTYVIDSHGHKYIPPNPGAQRTIHFFGDSTIFGHGVTNDDTALNIVAKKLGSRANVVNYGVMGYGFEQIYLRLYEAREQIAPGDVVVFAPIPGDIARNLLGKRFVCDLYNRNFSGVETFPYFDHGTWRTEKLGDHCPRGDLPIAMIRRHLMLAQASKEDQLAQNASQILALARQVVEQRGARFFVLFLINPNECASGDIGFDLSLLDAEFSSTMDSCDTVEPGPDIVFKTDPHLNAKGNAWLADAILAFLNTKVLDDRSGDRGTSGEGKWPTRSSNRMPSGNGS